LLVCVGETAMAGNVENPNNDMPVQQPPTDSISQIVFSPVANILAASSWSKEVRVWEVAPNGQTIPKLSKMFAAPLMSCDFNSTGDTIFAAGCDKTASAWHLATNQASQVALCDAPIRTCKFLSNEKLLITGSWDTTICYWDCRTPKPAVQVKCGERVYAMDATSPLLTVCLSNRKCLIFDISKPSQPFRVFESPLKMQTRCVANFSNTKDSFAIGSIEGRVAIHHVEEKSRKNFSFKCHRHNENVFSVNSIAVHPYGTFATAGSDGAYTFWDKDSKQRLKLFKPAWNSITSCCFNNNGSIFAYALSYDWSRGIAGDPKRPNQIFLHAVGKDEIQPRPKT